MSNPNLIKVWSPTGEMVETSRANARDLTTHAGWLASPPIIIEKTIVVTATEESGNAVGQTETETQTETTPEVVVEEPDDEVAEFEALDDEVEKPAIRKTEADFDDLETREDVVAYLAAFFPLFKPHHLAKREGLIAKAIELANA